MSELIQGTGTGTECRTSSIVECVRRVMHVDIGRTAIKDIAFRNVVDEIMVWPSSEERAENRRRILLDNGSGALRLRDGDHIMRSPTDELDIIFGDPVMLESFLATIAARATFDAMIDEGRTEEEAQALFGTTQRVAAHLLDGVSSGVTIDGRTHTDSTVAYRADRLTYLLERLDGQKA